MERTFRVIVLRRRDSGESDRRLVLFSLEDGKIDAIAKGARKSASRLAAASEPLAVSTMTLVKGKANRFATQAQLSLSYRRLRQDYDRLTQALALAELYAAVLPYDLPSPELFDLLETSLTALEEHPKPVVALAWAQIKLMEAAGFMPSFSECSTSSEGIVVAEPWVSPRAGGLLSEEHSLAYADRFRVRAEVLYGLNRLVELDSPPMNLKFAEETVLALAPFWKHIAEMSLPSNDALNLELRDNLNLRVQSGR